MVVIRAKREREEPMLRHKTSSAATAIAARRGASAVRIALPLAAGARIPMRLRGICCNRDNEEIAYENTQAAAR